MLIEFLRCLVNELVLTFLAPIKCAQAQFSMIILSRVIEYTTYYYIQTDKQMSSIELFQ